MKSVFLLAVASYRSNPPAPKVATIIIKVRASSLFVRGGGTLDKIIRTDHSLFRLFLDMSNEFSEWQDFDDEQNESDNSHFDISKISRIVVYGTDWTTETILSQLTRKNIQLNPRFQRRDAWNIKRKSRFIESLILGLPIPQIVLAEKEKEKGQYLVLDGKQRLLTILQFYNKSESANNNFRLSGLELLSNLNGCRFEDIKDQPSYRDPLDNQTIRTTIIRNWYSEEFLYTVFLRLNVENTPLSPQELRQALNPGEFIDYLDDKAIESRGLKIYFNSKQPDFRMRDTQLLLRYIAFQYFLPEYKGNLKAFLNKTCKEFNSTWNEKRNNIEETVAKFEEAIATTIEVFGSDNFARVWLSDKQKYERQRNLSVLETMLFYFSDAKIRQEAKNKKEQIEEKFKSLCETSVDFISSVKSSTNTIGNTYNRLALWGKALQEVLQTNFNIPQLSDNHILFQGLTQDKIYGSTQKI